MGGPRHAGRVGRPQKTRYESRSVSRSTIPTSTRGQGRGTWTVRTVTLDRPPSLRRFPKIRLCRVPGGGESDFLFFFTLQFQRGLPLVSSFVRLTLRQDRPLAVCRGGGNRYKSRGGVGVLTHFLPEKVESQTDSPCRGTKRLNPHSRTSPESPLTRFRTRVYRSENDPPVFKGTTGHSAHK